mgnify:CR=1 FL=1
MSTPFKMSGMAFKEGQAPMKFINFKNLAKKVGAKGENKLSKTLDKVGDAQEKFVSWKKKHGLKTDRYDASVKDEDGAKVTVPDTSTDSTVEEVDLTKKEGKGPTEVTNSALLPVAPGLHDPPKV